MKKKAIRTAFLDTIPVMTGYVFLGFGFGILLHQSGYGALWCLAMSLFIYAGSMQYMAVSLLSGGAGLLTAALTTFVVNARHLFYGISMLDKYKGTGLKKLYLIFGMCDESFSINYTAKIPENVDKGWFMLFITLLNQLYWVTGSTLGGIFGSFLHFNTEGLDFVMTAMFVVIFLEQWLKDKDHISSCLGLALPLLCLILFGADHFLLPAMAALLAVLSLMRPFLEPRVGG